MIFILVLVAVAVPWVLYSSSFTSGFDSDTNDSEDERKTVTSLLDRRKSSTQADTSTPRTMKRTSHPIGSVDVEVHSHQTQKECIPVNVCESFNRYRMSTSSV